MKLIKIAENDGPINWESQKPKNTEEAYAWAVKQELSARHQKAVFMEKLKPYEKHVITSWDPDKLGDVIAKMKYHYHWWGMPKGTPNGEKLWKAISFFIGRYEHARKLEGRYGRLVAKLKKVARTETFNDLKYKIPEKTIPSAEVPRRVYYDKDHYFNNPYWDKENVVSRYAGTIGHYANFSSAERNVLVELDRTLVRAGLKGMEKIYASTRKNGKWTDNRFVAVGADGRVVWKRIGGNVVYVDGKRISISYLTDTNATSLAMQQKILGPLKTTSKPFTGQKL
jgi:hypothetical protein